jgi:prepilin-type N-terminal cleavage/methylation domain-containing protein/prepilin-type processing-associated H-X9-DG protein
MKKPNSNTLSFGTRSGFTLTELLVVILIIAVLATLGLMGVRSMRAAADKANSTRNLSQFQIANAAYATEQNGKFVSIRTNDEKGNATRWFQVPGYVENLIGPMFDNSGKQVLTLPLQLLDPKVVRARKFEYDRVFASYGMNDTGLPLGNDPGLDSGHNLNQMPDPSRSMAFSTAIDFRVTYNSRFNWKLENQLDTRQAPGSVGAMAYRHKDTALVVYFDGHVGEITQGEMKAIDGRGGKSNPFWNPKAR